MKVPRQPEVNIGMVGHVDHGKTTLTEALTGEWTDRHSEEIKRGISIRLGYADTALYKCPQCEEPKCYGVQKECKHCGSKTELLRAVSFVDAPGHETLMATMLSGAALMDGALLLIATNEPCPQPQTKEHLMALEISGVTDIIVVQNKIDLVDEATALANYEQICNFIEGTCAEGAPIIPISAHHDANLDVLLAAMEKHIPTPKHKEGGDARMYVARSFDVNKPGCRPKDIVGGVIGGSLIQGTLEVGDELEIKPGRKTEEKGNVIWDAINTEITTLIAGGKFYEHVKPGGLVGIGTTLDPSLTKSDSLTGSLAGVPGTLPPIWHELTAESHLLEYVVGSSEDIVVDKIRMREPLMLNAGTATTVGIVRAVHDDELEIDLKIPICIEEGHRITINRRIGGRWRLIGYGIIK
jgi:translation initiation factor 2 subunit 3